MLGVRRPLPCFTPLLCCESCDCNRFNSDCSSLFCCRRRTSSDSMADCPAAAGAVAMGLSFCRLLVGNGPGESAPPAKTEDTCVGRGFLLYLAGRRQALAGLGLGGEPQRFHCQNLKSAVSLIMKANVFSILAIFSAACILLVGATDEAGTKYLEEKSKEADVITLPSGLRYKVLEKGNGAFHPTVSSPCLCHYGEFY